MTESLAKYDADMVRERIFTIRGQKVILDHDLAAVYGVETKALNRAVKRNANRFPPDFIFQLTKDEDEALRCQIGTSNGRGGRRYLPYAFTEHGAIMTATVLNSSRAVQMSVFVVRAFVRMRTALTDTRELARKLAALEREVKGRLDTHDAAIVDVLARIMDLIDPQELPEPPRKQIGFSVKEKRAKYSTKKRSGRKPGGKARKT
jgi:hypothetical protein